VKPKERYHSHLQVSDQVVSPLNMDQFVKHYCFKLGIVEVLAD
jgi:hypothetical protein